MLACLHHAPARGVSWPIGRLADAQGAVRATRTKTTKTDAVTKLTTPIAEKLHKAKIWHPSKRATKGSLKREGFNLKPTEGRRVNIVSEKLCDDIIQRLGPSLERHRGCDLLDLNPGASVWSRALHDAIQPRRHIMMEPSANDYQPFRQEMMGDRNIEVIPKSGLIWSDLNAILASHMDTHHRRLSSGEQPERNDMLLVTANLATFPKRTLWNFGNIATMILYQLVASIRSSTLFQQYGSVRMLVWVNDDIKRRMVPRSILGRKRPAFEAEISCDWIHEVAGYDVPDSSTERLSVRDQWMQYESTANALRRMEEQGLVTPPGRETSMFKTVSADPSLLNQKLAGQRAPVFQRAYMSELEEMEAEETEGHDKENQRRLTQLRYRDRHDMKTTATYLELLQLHDSILEMDPSSPGFAAASRDYDERIDGLKKNPRNEFYLIRDGYQLFRHQPSQSLLWDRRAFEPLAIDSTEFYPNAPTSLLDIQPKAMNPVFRQQGPSSSRSGDYSSLILRSFFNNTTYSIPSAMDNVWPGFADMAREHCPSLWDTAKGGSPMTGCGTLNVRAMNETHWTELVNAWMRWPFRPDYLQMLGRTVEGDDGDDEAELRGSAQGNSG